MTVLAAQLPSVEEARRHVGEFLRRVEAYADPAVWIHRAAASEVEAQLARAIDRLHAGRPSPLFGLTVAVKDNIDVEGMPTTCACPAFAFMPAKSATVVQRLSDAGAIVVGKTNLDQFATGLVGTRSPYGAPRNVYDGRYIAGGSSSGSAVAVAANLVDFALGTDTAGSGRVPASFNNIVGLKPSRGLLSTAGVFPACRSLDCVSIFARDVDLAELAFDTARGFDAADIYSRDLEQHAEIPESFTFGIPSDHDLEFFGDADSEWLFRRAIQRMERIGGREVIMDFAPFRAAAKLLYEGPWVAERYVAVKELITREPDALLPVTRRIIEGATRFTAVDAFEAQYKLLGLRRLADEQLARTHILLLPTTGTIYTIKQVDAEPVKLNQNLGYYTNFVNLLDMAAIAIPAGFLTSGLPAGVTLIGPAGHDRALIGLGRRFASEGNS